jgi:hypothetical protein
MKSFVKVAYKMMYLLGVLSLVASLALSLGASPARAQSPALNPYAGQGNCGDWDYKDESAPFSWNSGGAPAVFFNPFAGSW